MAKQSNNNLGRWVAEKMQKMTTNMQQKEDLNERIDVLVPYEDLLTGARDALEAYGAKEEELSPVSRGLALVAAEMKALEMRLEFELELKGE